MNPALPADVQALLRERIGSYEQLHILLLLFQDRTEWSAEALAARFELPANSVSAAVSVLVTHGFVAANSESPAQKYRYASGVWDRAIEALVHAYQEQPLAVIRLLAEQSIERIRADALRAFADAFVFRKGK
jgi:DNA-binding IclR family transcriptional regulator